MFALPVASVIFTSPAEEVILNAAVYSVLLTSIFTPFSVILAAEVTSMRSVVDEPTPAVCEIVMGSSDETVRTPGA